MHFPERSFILLLSRRNNLDTSLLMHSILNPEHFNSCTPERSTLLKSYTRLIPHLLFLMAEYHSCSYQKSFGNHSNVISFSSRVISHITFTAPVIGSCEAILHQMVIWLWDGLPLCPVQIWTAPCMLLRCRCGHIACTCLGFQHQKEIDSSLVSVQSLVELSRVFLIFQAEALSLHFSLNTIREWELVLLLLTDID